MSRRRERSRRRFMAVGDQQLAEQKHLWLIIDIPLEDQKVRLSREQEQDALAFMDYASQSPPLGCALVQG